MGVSGPSFHINPTKADSSLNGALPGSLIVIQGQNLGEPYPPFYYLYYINKIIGDKMIKKQIVPDKGNLLSFVSSYEGGGIGMLVINKSTTEQSFQVDIPNYKIGDNYYWYELSKYNDGNIWSEKIAINGISNPKYSKGGPSENLTEIPAWTRSTKQGIKMKIAGLSAIYLLIEEKE
jgi:hypothetical protein